MGKIRADMTMSLDGYVAGPDMDPENGLGQGGERLHRWIFDVPAWRVEHGLEGGGETSDDPIVQEMQTGVGAYVMGRHMFGGGTGSWGDPAWNDGDWRGWWGDDPPFHAPVFVLTHHAREPLEMDGGTTFTFVTDGFDAALAQARAAAGDQDVLVAGGASAVQQALHAGVVDELQLHIATVLLGDGVRLFDLLPAQVELEKLRVVDSDGVTHLKYRVVR